jgi:hypothetical protein
MTVKDMLGEFCYPIYEPVDVKKLYTSIQEFFNRLNISESVFFDDLKQRPVTTCNLNNIAGITGKDRWCNHRGDHLSVLRAGIKEENFSEFISELDGLYIKEVIDNIYQSHIEKFKTKFQGRCQLIWSRPGHCYGIHYDKHTKHRYHIPVYTDEYFFWIFQQANKDTDLVHMPADGRIWYLNPKDVMHTVTHVGTTPRLHILLTSGY